MKEMTTKALQEETIRREQNDNEVEVMKLILRVATHETGHYIVGHSLINYRRTILLSTMYNQMDGSLGRHTGAERIDVQKQRQDFINEIAELLAGEVATELYLNNDCTEKVRLGNQDDLKKATELAKKVAAKDCFKSKKICAVCQKSPKHLKKRILEEKKNSVLKEAEMLARETILKHEKQFIKVRNELIRKRELTGEELELLYNED